MENERDCLGCRGRGEVLVASPGVACPVCKGGGRADLNPGYWPLCTICNGTGWLLPRLTG